MSQLLIQDSTMTAIADAIREKTGTSEMMSPSQMVNLIKSIEVAGVTRMVSGVITPTSNTTSGTLITHNLGAEPQAILFFALTRTNARNAIFAFFNPSKGNSNSISIYIQNKNNTIISITATESETLWGSETTNTSYDRICGINANTFVTPINLQANVNYIWVVFGESLI